MENSITVEATVNAPVEVVWEKWTNPNDITQWCNASDDWHAPNATNDLRNGGKFSTTMAAKDGSMSFDFGGTYTSVQAYKSIDYTMDDGRKTKIIFTGDGLSTKVTETFEPENTNPKEMQQMGWQAILNNFKKYVES
jgi:uncharacterized protein YndB with AHSA1/START domain